MEFPTINKDQSTTRGNTRIVMLGWVDRQAGWRFRRGLVLAMVLLVAGCQEPLPTAPVPLSTADKVNELAEELHAAIWHRLALMPTVAQSKFHHQRSITDRARETEVIEQFRDQAYNRGIQPDFAERVICAQIEAAKVVQTRLYEQWQQQPPPDDRQLANLIQELRPTIDAATERMLVALQLLGEHPQALNHAIEHAYARRSPLPPQVPNEAWDLAWAPLREAPQDYLASPEAQRQLRFRRPVPPESIPLLPDFAAEESP